MSIIINRLGRWRGKMALRCPLAKVVIAFTGIALLPPLVQADGAIEAWVRPYNGPGNTDDQGRAMAVDRGGNLYVLAYSGGDYATIKYSSAGVGLWTNRYNGPGNLTDTAVAVAVDTEDNLYVTGHASVGGYTDYATIKYSSAGVGLWTNRYGGPSVVSTDFAAGMALDSSNNVVVTGASRGTSSSYDYATIKYSSAGVALWTNRYNGPANTFDSASAIAVDSGNNVIVTGASEGVGTWYDFATIKYSSTGAGLWTNRFGQPGSSWDQAVAVAVDLNDNIYVTGYALGTVAPDYDYTTIAYSSAGVPLWTNRYNGPANGEDKARAVAVDASNNIYVTGYSDGGGSRFDYATIKYSSAGLPLWTNRYNGPGNSNDCAVALAVRPTGTVYVTGYSWVGLTPYGYDNNDYVTIGYSSAGTALWTNRYSGPSNLRDEAAAVAVDASGNVYVTGYSATTTGANDVLTIKYVTLDTTPPDINCPVDVAASADPGQCYATAVALAMPVATDDSGSVIVTSNAPAQFPVGTNTITWTATDPSGNSNTCSQLVVVLDTQMPSLTCPSEVMVNADVGQCHASGVALGTPVASDNCAIAAVTNDAPVQFAVGTNTVTWTVTDANGNANLCAQIVVVRDNPPAVTASPQSRTNAIGSVATFSAGGSACTPWAFQWLKNNTNHLVDGGRVSGATTDTLRLENVQSEDAGSYSLLISNSTGSTNSQSATLTVLSPLRFTSTAVAGSDLVLSGMGGSAGSQFYLLASSELAEPMSNWVRVATNTFGPGGSFTVTNVLDPGTPRQFFRLQLP